MMRGKRSLKAVAFLAALTITAGMASGLIQSRYAPAPLTAWADEEGTDGNTGTLYYTKYSDHVSVWGSDYQATSIEVPAAIEGVPVTVIGDYAFNGSSASTITLPDTITSIGNWAFAGNSNLKSFTIPDSVEYVGIQAFDQCRALTEINFPDHLVKFDGQAFRDTPWLEAQRKKSPFVIVNGDLVDAQTCTGAIEVPSEVEYISPDAFMRSSVTSVVVPASVKEILDNTFAFCDSLTSVELKGVEKIGLMAFYDTQKLTDLKLSGKLKTIVSGAFMDDDNVRATITFYGSEATWNGVEKDSEEAYLKNATMVFDESHSDPEVVKGDINDDGSFNIADAVALQKYLLANPDNNVKNWKNGDLVEDDKLNVYDLIAMRTELTK
ncbi:MAG: leucine-rich repeat protein [Ruminococcus sp.]|nr:leucine-rich repeat protein [Ruminococcus sp.]